MTDARQPPALPAAPHHDAEVPVHLERLAETARDYARGAKAAATLRAYAADWRHYTAWCRRRGLGNIVAHWCFAPQGDLPMGDVLLGQKIALETMERDALKRARRNHLHLADA
jgi:hypothetical protein